MDLTEIEWYMWTGFIWFSVGSSDGLLWLL